MYIKHWVRCNACTQKSYAGNKSKLRLILSASSDYIKIYANFIVQIVQNHIKKFYNEKKETPILYSLKMTTMNAQI